LILICFLNKMGHWCFVSDTNLFASLCQALRKPKLALCAAKKNFEFLWIAYSSLLSQTCLISQLQSCSFCCVWVQLQELNKNQGFAGWFSTHMNDWYNQQCWHRLLKTCLCKSSMFIKHLFSFVLFHLIKMFQLGTR